MDCDLTEVVLRSIKGVANWWQHLAPNAHSNGRRENSCQSAKQMSKERCKTQESDQRLRLANKRKQVVPGVDYKQIQVLISSIQTHFLLSDGFYDGNYWMRWKDITVFENHI